MIMRVVSQKKAVMMIKRRKKNIKFLNLQRLKIKINLIETGVGVEIMIRINERLLTKRILRKIEIETREEILEVDQDLMIREEKGKIMIEEIKEDE